MAILLTSFSTSSQAYVGPGAGLSVIGSILAFLTTILLLIVGFLWYPIKRILGLNKKNSIDENAIIEAKSESDTTETRPEHKGK